MNWKTKALVMDALSWVPFGARAHYWMQRRVTRSLPSSYEEFGRIFERAHRHRNTLVAHRGQIAMERAQFYEFGAGWELAIPLTLAAMGARSQILVDIRKLVRVELVNDTLKKLKQMSRENFALRVTGSLLPNGGSARWIKLLEEDYGIRYLAPCDARNTRLEEKSVDFITSTNTLEHIPAKDIRLILTECRRLLRKDGLMSFIIDYQDHYSYVDRGITAYNFLKYSDSGWRWYSPAFHYQNRLRHSDYLHLVREASFEVIEESVTEPSESDLAFLREAGIWEPFRKNYDCIELGIRSAHMVLRPAF
jgi:SAM-dependent methyltransferase